MVAETDGTHSQTARRRMMAACEGKAPKLAKGFYRIRGQRQVQLVFWPVVAGPPDAS